jgi:hypothetical protein
VSGASGLFRDGEVPMPCLHTSCHWRPAAHAAAASLADSDNEVPIPHFLPRVGVTVMTRFLFRARCFLVFVGNDAYGGYVHESVCLIHSMKHVLFGLHSCETRLSEHIGISPAGEGWTVGNGNVMCFVAALT